MVNLYQARESWKYMFMAKGGPASKLNMLELNHQIWKVNGRKLRKNEPLATVHQNMDRQNDVLETVGVFANQKKHHQINQQ